MLKRKAIAILLVSILALGACKSQDVPTLSAALSELTGKVDLKQEGSDAFSPAAADSVLDVNGQIQTGDDGRVRLDLSTGTIVRVAPSSMFTLTSNDEVDGGLATKIKLELGQIFIILNGGTAEVETPSGVASVRGSYMMVEVDSETGDVYVTCLEGDCGAENPAGGVTFTQGEKTLLFHQNEDGTWTVPNVEPMTPEDFEEWLNENPEAKDLFDQGMAALTATAAAAPTATDEPTATPEATPTIVSALPPAGSSGPCGVIRPARGSALPHQGQVLFEWESQPGAQKYVITFTNNNGNTVSFETTENSMEKYIEVLPEAGEYDWQVAAYGEGGNALCDSGPVEFSKPDSNPQPEPVNPQEPDPEPVCDPMDCEGSCPDSYYCGQ
jgi:hypothetical protein